MAKSWSEILGEKSDSLKKALEGDRTLMEGNTALPGWVKYLMALQMDSIFNHPKGAAYYGKRAKELGASDAQVAEAIELVRMFAGRPAMATAAEAFREDE